MTKTETQVFLKYNDRESQRPHDDERKQGRQAWQPQRAHLPGENREHLAVGGQVGGDEEHNEDLCQLAGLEAKRAEAQPQLAAARLVADDGQHGREQKQNTDDHQRVLVIGKLVQVAHGGQCDHHGCHADEKPEQLVDSQVGHDAGYKGNADTRKRKGNGQNGRVCCRGQQTHGDVRHEKCSENAQRNAERIKGKLLAARDHHHGEKHNDNGRGDDQEHELYIAARHRLASFVAALSLSFSGSVGLFASAAALAASSSAALRSAISFS